MNKACGIRQTALSALVFPRFNLYILSFAGGSICFNLFRRFGVCWCGRRWLQPGLTGQRHLACASPALPQHPPGHCHDTTWLFLSHDPQFSAVLGIRNIRSDASEGRAVLSTCVPPGAPLFPGCTSALGNRQRSSSLSQHHLSHL